MILGVPKEIAPGEKRVSLVPDAIAKLKGTLIQVETSAGEAASYPDSAYTAKGASICANTASLFQASEIVLKVQPPAPKEVELFREGCTSISFLYPGANLDSIKMLVAKKASAFGMELMPRISRAQTMDALSSQATISGYKAVVMAADSLPMLFPLLMTAAGTISPTKVLIIGAGVAGLQAISVARRLGAVVEAYDVRPAVKEQVMSLGAKFVELPIEAKEAQDAGGYAKAQTEEFYKKQQKLLGDHSQGSDVVITTALVPGQRAPILIPEEAVKGMRPGSVIVDLAAEQGGNCSLTEPGRSVVKYGVTIHGPLNLPSTMAPEASRLYSNNITSFLLTMLKDGSLNVDPKDDLVRGALVVHNGLVMHEPTRRMLEGGQR
jgi:NAD(P) transhydrogenase subunit alpha